MGRLTGKTCRLITMLTMTFSFFLVELVVGHVTKSLALVSDSYHMLSDVVALVVGIACVRISKLRSQKNTYGWARAEVLGALVNSVFLVALCFTIFVEAIERLTEEEQVKQEDLMLYVGIAGLVVNLLGLALFSQHAHGHSHGGGGHSHSKSKKKDDHSHGAAANGTAGKHSHGDGEKGACATEAIALHDTTVPLSTASAQCCEESESDDSREDEEERERATVSPPETGTTATITKPRKQHSPSQLNMRGVFLHVLGDALGSVVVIVSALIIKFAEGEWRFKYGHGGHYSLYNHSTVCPAAFLSTILCDHPRHIAVAFLLIIAATVPTHIQVASLKDKLINKVQGVLAVHEFHVWQLAGNRIIASAHIRCRTPHEYMRIAEEVKSFFHDEGIHSTTVQPEFVEFEELSTERDCVLECGPDKTCYPDTCCAARLKNVPSLANTSDQTLRQRSVINPETEGNGQCTNAGDENFEIVTSPKDLSHGDH